MTPKQQAFVDEYLKDQNASAAAVRAGYSARSAPSLMAQQAIRDEIKRRQETIATEAGVTLQSLLAEAERARQVAEEGGNAAAMSTAIALKAKLSGLASDTQVQVNIPETNADPLNVALAVLALFRDASVGPRGHDLASAVRKVAVESNDDPLSGLNCAWNGEVLQPKPSDASDDAPAAVAEAAEEKPPRIFEPGEAELVGNSGHYIQAESPPAGDGRQKFAIWAPNSVEPDARIWGRDAAIAAVHQLISEGAISR